MKIFIKTRPPHTLGSAARAWEQSWCRHVFGRGENCTGSGACSSCCGWPLHCGGCGNVPHVMSSCLSGMRGAYSQPLRGLPFTRAQVSAMQSTLTTSLRAHGCGWVGGRGGWVSGRSGGEQAGAQRHTAAPREGHAAQPGPHTATRPAHAAPRRGAQGTASGGTPTALRCAPSRQPPAATIATATDHCAPQPPCPPPPLTHRNLEVACSLHHTLFSSAKFFPATDCRQQAGPKVFNRAPPRHRRAGKHVL